MYKKIAKIIFITLVIIILNTLSLINSVYATTTIKNAQMQSAGDCGELLKYKGVIVKTYFMEYNNLGTMYPAYCLDKYKTGVSDKDSTYSVSVENAINDVQLWRILINGYPYKTIEELGVNNKEEAFTATKQAVYTYIHKNQLSDYEAIGEAGQRTLNALYKIVENAKNSNEVQMSNKVEIKAIKNYWDQDIKEKEYISKEYKIITNTNIQNYKVKITDEQGQQVGNIKVTDAKNNEKVEFNSNETFKILVPLKYMKEGKKIKINIETKVETKPILYGKAENTDRQDCALTAAMYEEGNGEYIDEYDKNQTKIIIIKQDEDTQERLEGVEFQLLDENQNVIYTNLQTDKNGKIEIENLIPGKYYIKESRTINGYEIYQDLIEADVNLNEEITVSVNNHKQDVPKIEKVNKEKEVTNTKILPITGM